MAEENEPILLEDKKQKIAKLLKIDPDIIQTFYAKEAFYRNRMDFTFHDKGLGLRAPGKWYEIVDVKESDLAIEAINEKVKEIREKVCSKEGFNAFNVREKHGAFMYAVIRITSLSSSVCFVLNKESKMLKRAEEIITEYANESDFDNVLIGYVKSKSSVSITNELNIIRGSEFLKEKILDKTFEFHSQGFFQTNKDITEKMLGYIKDLSKTFEGKHLIDLYGGVGLLGISVSEHFKRVDIIESYPLSIESAKRNVSMNNVENVFPKVADAKEVDKADIPNREELDMILDPPRSGMNPKALRRIIRLSPKNIIYVSCNPKAFSKEYKSFLEAGYTLKNIALFDMFPKTKHFEMVSKLHRG